uniref:Uncharacterized protein n=1 Tax=Steinernema glaseri TaxID=37863 RepID=A0A1I8A111_9BILA
MAAASQPVVAAPNPSSSTVIPHHFLSSRFALSPPPSAKPSPSSTPVTGITNGRSLRFNPIMNGSKNGESAAKKSSPPSYMAPSAWNPTLLSGHAPLVTTQKTTPIILRTPKALRTPRNTAIPKPSSPLMETPATESSMTAERSNGVAGARRKLDLDLAPPGEIDVVGACHSPSSIATPSTAASSPIPSSAAVSCAEV